MGETDLFAFYGSLRKGMSNYKTYQHYLEYVSTNRLTGYAMYALTEYPYAVHSAKLSDSMVIEIYRIKNEAVKEKIYHLELDAGYIFDQIEIEGKTVGIYLFREPGNDPKVISGDWVEFYGI